MAEPVSTQVPTDGRASSQRRGSRRPKPRKFYLVLHKPHARPKGVEHVNREATFGDGHPRIFAPPGSFDRGFRDYPVVPRFRVSKRLGRRPCDIERHHCYWLVSDRAKRVLSELSAGDFKFLALETEVDPGQDPVTLWLCEVMTRLDAVDETRSDVIIKQNDIGRPVYHITSKMVLIFQEAIVGQHHAFRLSNNFNTIVCDDVMREAVRENKLTGLSYQDLSPSNARCA